MLRRHAASHASTTTGPRAWLQSGSRALAALVLVASAAGAQTTPVLTFESAPLGVTLGDFAQVRNCFVENGITVTAVGEACGLPMRNGQIAADVPTPFVTYLSSNASYTGSRAITNNLGTPVSFTTMGAQGFNLLSIDLAPIAFDFSPAPAGNMMVMFSGMRIGGGMATQSFNLSLDGRLQRFLFNADFRNLSSVQFEAGAPDFAVQFDNVNASSVVPEPSTYALMATGLLGVATLARRRRRA